MNIKSASPITPRVPKISEGKPPVTRLKIALTSEFGGLKKAPLDSGTSNFVKL